MKRLIVTAIAGCLASGPALAAMTLEDLDASGDGFATYEEIRDAIPRLNYTDFRRLDGNGDNRVSAQELQESDAQTILTQHSVLPPNERAVSLIDTDGDGFMSMDDFKRVYTAFPETSFNKIDLNGDHRVSYNEYYTPETFAAISSCQESNYVDLASVDKDGDRFLSWEEALAAMPKMTQNEFRQIDVNSDNRLSAVEFNLPDARCILDQHGG